MGEKTAPKNRHFFCSVDGMYIKWNELLRDVLNGTLIIIQNQTLRSESESETEHIHTSTKNELVLHNVGKILTAFWFL